MKRLARKYWMVIEKDTGYLVGVVPYTRKNITWVIKSEESISES